MDLKAHTDSNPTLPEEASTKRRPGEANLRRLGKEPPAEKDDKRIPRLDRRDAVPRMAGSYEEGYARSEISNVEPLAAAGVIRKRRSGASPWERPGGHQLTVGTDHGESLVAHAA